MLARPIRLDLPRKAAWGKRHEIRPRVLRAWWNTRLPVRRRLAARSGSAKSGGETLELETGLGKPPFLHRSVFVSSRWEESVQQIRCPRGSSSSLAQVF